MVIVAKIGDRTISSAFSEDSLADLENTFNQTPMILVHGGGGTVTKIAHELGVEQKFVTSPEGFRSRYTDYETIQVYTMVMAGKINKEIVRWLQRRKLPAVGISGLDGGLIRASRKSQLVIKDERGRRVAIEGGYTGKITEVDIHLLETLLNANYLPVIAPIALGEEFAPLNIDGDRAAAHVAGAIKAETLVLLTDVDGVSVGNAVSRQLTSQEAKTAITTLGPGMITKVHAALEALSLGVERAIIAPGNVPNPFSSAIKHTTGTVITQ